MTDNQGTLYGLGARNLQDAFDTRRLADRLVEVTVKDHLSEPVINYIGQATYFYLATVDADGFPDVSYKGGIKGFVSVTDKQTLRIPSYDGNGMFRSLGNVADTGRVALLFIRQNERANRMRIHGTAKVVLDPSVVSQFEGADAVLEVSVTRVFPNCPRYVHNLSTGEVSEFAPAPGHIPPEAEWKSTKDFTDVLPKNN